MLYVLNLGEGDADRLHQREVEYREGALAGRKQTSATAVCGKIEAELAELAPRGTARLPGQLRSAGVRAGAADHGHVRAVGTDELSDRRGGRSARLDDSDA